MSMIPDQDMILNIFNVSYTCSNMFQPVATVGSNGHGWIKHSTFTQQVGKTLGLGAPVLAEDREPANSAPSALAEVLDSLLGLENR